MNTKTRVIAGTLALAACLGAWTPLANAATPAPAAAPATVEVGTEGIGTAIRAIITLLKKKGPNVWNACVSAVRAGWAAFKKWYDDLPWVVKAAIRAVSPGLTVYEIYQGLREAIG
ncbi:hypothetical protein [Allokutzneria albata]|uniref:Uncharacterized protein n=1 Tax=Allokutzneria albata TaxID=211114 RepID=A0A1G9WSF3_ALLAB|nr:hypothetical protein [Allokutzneria albata]SDM87534.1 hypothetical protein SAMN04489726_3791 [Allokutzneria albata]